jgi:hypothetical protein
VRLQEQFDPAQVAALKRFHQDFFDRVNEATDPRSVAQLTSEALAGEARDLQVLLDQSGVYRFLRQLQAPAARIQAISAKGYAYLLGHLAEFADELLDAKDDLLAPVKAFMHGPQRRTYDEALAFYREEAANFGEIDAAELEPLRLLAESATPFRGAVLPNARAAMTRLRGLIDERLATERAAALAILDQREAQLRGIEAFEKLDRDRQAQVLAKTTEARAAIAAARFVAAIRDRIARYTAQEYPAQLDWAAKLAAPSRVTEKPGNAPHETRYIPISGLKVSCQLPYIASEADLEQWLAALRQAAVEELLKGNRISL